MIYNGLVAMRQRTNQAFADIDVQLKQRHDLIPNLVETVKGCMKFEQETLERAREWGYIDPADKKRWLRHLDYYVTLQQMADDPARFEQALG